MGKSEKIDYERLEEDYRAGVLSLREVARKHGCSGQYLSKIGKKRGWTRDLTAKVRRATRRKVATKPAPPATLYTPEEEAAIVDRVSDEVADVILEQRRDTKKFMDASVGMIDETTGAKDEPVSQRASALNSAASAYAKTVPLYRQSYNMDEPITDRQAEAFESMSEEELLEFIEGCLGEEAA